MPTPQDLKDKFWKALESDRTMMLGLDGVEDGHARPMSAQVEGETSPIWFFTSTDNGIVEALGSGATTNRAIATFAAKGHDLFATVHGSLYLDTNRAVIDRLWNRYVAAWYQGGKTDPKLALLRLDAERAEIWQDASSVMSGLKLFFGMDPKADYKDKVANVRLN